MSKRRVGGLIAAALLLTFAPTVLGHAELAMADPPDKSTVKGSPSEIVFTFTEAVDPKKSSLKLVNGSGAIVADGGTVDPADAKTMHLVVPPQPPGNYTVRWTTASAVDGDIAHGTTTFTIVAAAPSPSGTPSATAGSNATASQDASPSAAPTTSASPAPAPSGGSGTPTSTSDAVIPVIATLIVLAALGLWLLGSRSRRVG